MTEIKPKSRLEKLKEQQKKLAAKIQQAQSRTKQTERKQDTRRKILIGSYYLDKANEKKDISDIKKLMDGYLKRDNDRAVFGLPPLDKSN